MEGEGFIYSVTGKGSYVAPLREIDHSRVEQRMKEFRTAALELMQLGTTREELCQVLEQVEQEEKHD